MRRLVLTAGISLSLILACAITAQSPRTAHPATAPPLDINTATQTQLAALPGMGWEYAQRVIAGRPYRAKNQLSQLGILPDAEYQRIKDLIVAHRARTPEAKHR